MDTAPRKLCPSCNDQVPTVWRDSGGWRELRCGYCGLTLDRTREGFDSPAEPAVAADQALAQAPKQLPPLILLAEDSRLIRAIVGNHLRARFPKAQILVGTDGRRALVEAARALQVSERRGVAIFDLQMPKLNGLAAAIALRAIEEAFGRKPLPVIFFSSVRINDSLRAAMQEVNPAAYLHKSNSDNPEAMVGRLEQVMAAMIRHVYEV